MRNVEKSAWRNMVCRCHDANHVQFPQYGGRGITVCDEWRKNFDSFLAHIGPRPSPLLSLDRIDNDKGYEPGNVRWATRKTQAQNTRRTIVVEIDGERKCLIEWARHVGQPYCTIRDRYYCGLRGQELLRGRPKKPKVVPPVRAPKPIPPPKKPWRRPVTDRQVELLSFVASSHLGNGAVGAVDLMAEFGFNRSTAKRHVEAMTRHGLLTRMPRTMRTLLITEAGYSLLAQRGLLPRLVTGLPRPVAAGLFFPIVLEAA